MVSVRLVVAIAVGALVLVPAANIGLAAWRVSNPPENPAALIRLGCGNEDAQLVRVGVDGGAIADMTCERAVRLANEEISYVHIDTFRSFLTNPAFLETRVSCVFDRDVGAAGATHCQQSTDGP